MGRYTCGDLEHKFWFGVQSSDDADHFGVEGIEPEPDEDGDTDGLDYGFEKEDLPKVIEGIKLCKKQLGVYKKLLDKFFEDNGGYNDIDIARAFKIPEKRVKLLLEIYARLDLGIKIRDCIKKKGQCYFWAEC